MIAALGVDELHVDPHAVSAALDAAFEDIAHVEVAPDLLHVGGLPFVGEGGVAGDDERARDAREVGGEALGDAVGEIFLFGIAADIGERQHDEGEARRRRIFRALGVGAGFACSGCADVKRIDPDRLGDVLELGRAEIGDREIEPPLDLPIGVLGQTDRPRLRRCPPAARRY